MIKGDKCWIVENGFKETAAEIVSVSENLVPIKKENEETLRIHTKQENGRYRDNDPDNTLNHAWLITDDNTIIDITGDQFKYCVGYAKKFMWEKNILFIRD